MKAFGYLALLTILFGCQTTRQSHDSYQIKPGDNLEDIANRHGVTVSEIAKLNNIDDPNRIISGDRIFIPQSSRRTSEEYLEASNLPVAGKITSLYGIRGGRMHYGIDIANRTGTPVKASKEGFVIASKWMKGFGQVVKIKSGSNTYLYAHLSKRLVKKGDVVVKGQTVGKVGSTGNATGPHLHFEIHVNNHPIDPLNYFDRSSSLAKGEDDNFPNIKRSSSN